MKTKFIKNIATLAAIGLFAPWASAQYTDSNGDTIAATFNIVDPIFGPIGGADLVGDINLVTAGLSSDLQTYADDAEADAIIAAGIAAVDADTTQTGLLQAYADDAETDAIITAVNAAVNADTAQTGLLETYADDAEADAITAAGIAAVDADTTQTGLLQTYADDAEADAITAAVNADTAQTGLLQAYADTAEADAIITAVNAAVNADTAQTGLLQAYADTAEADANAYTDAEAALRTELISSTGTNDDGNQVVHIGDNSLVTQELGGVQQLHAEDGAGNAIDIVVTNGSDFAVRTADPAATNSNIGINSGLNPQIIDPNPNDTLVPVVTTRDGLGLEQVDFSNSGVTLFQNGDVTLEQSSGNQLNVELGTVTSFDVDANTGVPVPGSQSWIAGYYTDAAGNIVDVTDFAAAVLADPTTAGDYTFNAINDPRFTSTIDEATLIANLQGIEPDDAVFNGIVGADNEPLVETTVLPGAGGNLQVGGNANVDGVLSVADNGAGGVADVAAAINGNAAAITTTQADVDQNEADSDFADAAIRGEFAAADTAIRGEFAIADANLQRQVTSNREDIDRNARGIAMVAALQHTTVLPGMTQALDVSAAHFEGETGLAINYSRRINDNMQINFGAASTSDFDESVIKAGIGWQW
jgi:hypothetical protein